MTMDDDIRKMVVEHETRLSRLEAEVKNMDSWMRGIDKKLDKLGESMSYMQGQFKKNSNSNGNNKKQYWTLLIAMGSNFFLLLGILLKLILR